MEIWFSIPCMCRSPLFLIMRRNCTMEFGSYHISTPFLIIKFDRIIWIWFFVPSLSRSISIPIMRCDCTMGILFLTGSRADVILLLLVVQMVVINAGNVHRQTCYQTACCRYLSQLCYSIDYRDLNPCHSYCPSHSHIHPGLHLVPLWMIVCSDSITLILVNALNRNWCSWWPIWNHPASFFLQTSSA